MDRCAGCCFRVFCRTYDLTKLAACMFIVVQPTVSNCCTLLQLEDFKMEGRTTSNRHSVDILIRFRGTMVAMEVDGPMHFTANRPYRRLGRTVLRDRMLAGQGLRVVSIPWFEWAECKGDQARQEYLLRKLEVAVARPGRRA